jgi:hypothetical protein
MLLSVFKSIEPVPWSVRFLRRARYGGIAEGVFRQTAAARDGGLRFANPPPPPYCVSTTPPWRSHESQTLSSQVMGRSTRRVRLVTVDLTVAPVGSRTW